MCAPGSPAATDLGDECQPFIPGAAIFGALFLFCIAVIIVHAPSLQICCACAECAPCRGKLPREALARNWLSWRLFNFAAFLLFCWNGVLALLAPEIDAATGGSGTGAEYFVTALTGLFIALGMRPAARRRFHGLLGGLALKGEARSAAAVAALVGGRDPAAALKHGADSFRGLPYASLGEADFATSGDTGLNQKTKPVTLGSVDAFLSHSWHDSAADKWKALSSWATSRKDAPSTLLWLDKACINQSDIDASLAALPVYLSGCKELLVLVGPTYCGRLWCVIELFTWLQMGGAAERVRVSPLPPEEGAAVGVSLDTQLATFDALQAQCYKADERQRLLGIIEEAFGDFKVFNAAVRSILTQRSQVVAVEKVVQQV